MSVRFYVFYRLSVPLLITFSDAPLDLRVGDDYSYGIILCIYHYVSTDYKMADGA